MSDPAPDRSPVCDWSGCSIQAAHPSAWCTEHCPMTWTVEDLLGDLTGATVERYLDGAVRVVEWCLDDGRRHREDGPARIDFGHEGEFRGLLWSRFGRTHRDSGPAMVSRHEGRWNETHYIDGNVHRANGPAALFFVDNSLDRETYYRADEIHRSDGPASIAYFGDGTVRDELFVLAGNRATEAEVQAYAEALASGATHEWALAFALGEAAS